MSSRPCIRPAAAEDIPTLIHLREQMLIELGSDDERRLADLAARSEAWFRDAFADGRAVGWLAECDGELVGGLTMTLLQTLPQYRSPNGRVASILGLFVIPGSRGEGLATCLVNEAVSFAREWQADVVMLHAADKARPLYERLGFVATKEMRLQFSEAGPVPAGGCSV